MYVFNLSGLLLLEKHFGKDNVGDRNNGKENITVFQKKDSITCLSYGDGKKARCSKSQIDFSRKCLILCVLWNVKEQEGSRDNLPLEIKSYLSVSSIQGCGVNSY